jgi:imidazolonepropionase
LSTLFKNIKSLLQVRDISVKTVSGKDMRLLPCIDNAYLLTEGNRIKDFGKMSECPEHIENEVDVSGKYILPTWCDPHTHLVFAATREGEFVDRINGLSYEEIANKGGGILNSAKKLQDTDEDVLLEEASKRLRSIIKMGTGAIEIKSGYGLTTESELKMLRVIRSLKQSFNIPIKSTFLGAHAIPPEYKNDPDKYVDNIINKMLPKVSSEGLADYIDVFCEKGYFNLAQTERILEAGVNSGLIPKIHVNQFNILGGVDLGVKYNALSVDHLEVMDNNDLNALAHSNTMATALPACSFFLGLPYTPGRNIIEKGLPLALASDFNPGSSPTGNMNFIVSLACIKMKLTPEEAINAATLNAAYAMNTEDTTGSICKGKKANFIVTNNIPSIEFIPYAFADQNIHSVYINGVLYN